MVGAAAREYGHAEVTIVAETPLFRGLPGSMNVWMSHGDEAESLPPGFELTATTDNAVAGIADEARKIWAVQFHPEVAHTLTLRLLEAGLVPQRRERDDPRLRQRLWGLDFASVIGGGAIVVEELAREFRARAGIDELVVSEHDILDGIVLSIAD